MGEDSVEKSKDNEMAILSDGVSGRFEEYTESGHISQILTKSFLAYQNKIKDLYSQLKKIDIDNEVILKTIIKVVSEEILKTIIKHTAFEINGSGTLSLVMRLDKNTAFAFQARDSPILLSFRKKLQENNCKNLKKYIGINKTNARIDSYVTIKKNKCLAAFKNAEVFIFNENETGKLKEVLIISDGIGDEFSKRTKEKIGLEINNQSIVTSSLKKTYKDLLDPFLKIDNTSLEKNSKKSIMYTKVILII